MKILTAMLASALVCSAALVPGAALAQPGAASNSAIGVDNFSADPLFKQYIADFFQIGHALQRGFSERMLGSLPAEVKAAAPAIPACLSEMQKEMFKDDIFVTPFLTRLQAADSTDRENFAALARFLHTQDGARLAALNHEANAVADKPDANGAPQLVEDRDAKLEQMSALLEKQPEHDKLVQARGGLGRLIEGLGDDPSADAALDKAGEKAHASPPCQAMEAQVAAYQKAHPEAGKK